MVLGIAAGALRFGRKLFEGVKRRRTERIEKRATAIVDSRDKLERFDNIFNGAQMSPDAGSREISEAGNNLFARKLGNIFPVSGAQAASEDQFSQRPGGMNPMILLLAAGGVILFLIMKKR